MITRVSETDLLWMTKLPGVAALLPTIGSAGVYVVVKKDPTHRARRILLARKDGQIIGFDISVYASDGWTLITDKTDVIIEQAYGFTVEIPGMTLEALNRLGGLTTGVGVLLSNLTQPQWANAIVAAAAAYIVMKLFAWRK